jgi:hypothetical protein
VRAFDMVSARNELLRHHVVAYVLRALQSSVLVWQWWRVQELSRHNQGWTTQLYGEPVSTVVFLGELRLSLTPNPLE